MASEDRLAIGPQHVSSMETRDILTETPVETLRPLYRKVQSQLNQLTGKSEGGIPPAEALTSLSALKQEIDHLREELDAYHLNLRDTEAYKWIDQQLQELQAEFHKRETAEQPGRRLAESRKPPTKVKAEYTATDAYRENPEIAAAIERIRGENPERASALYNTIIQHALKTDEPTQERLKKLLKTEDIGTAYVLLADKLGALWKRLGDPAEPADNINALLQDKDDLAKELQEMNGLLVLPKGLNDTLSWEEYQGVARQKKPTKDLSMRPIPMAPTRSSRPSGMPAPDGLFVAPAPSGTVNTAPRRRRMHS